MHDFLEYRHIIAVFLPIYNVYLSLQSLFTQDKCFFLLTHIDNSIVIFWYEYLLLTISTPCQ